MKTPCSFFILILIAHGIHSIPTNSTNTRDIVQRVGNNTGRSDGCDERVDHSVEVISWEPRATIYHNFLSKEECEHLINIAKPHMKRSTVFNLATKSTVIDTRFRVCSISFLDRGQDETVRAIEKRIAEFTFLPVELGEELQVLRYEVGQKFGPHYDSYHDDYNTRNGGQRMATVVMYLSDVEEGGEMVFPSAKGIYSDVRWRSAFSECGKRGLSVKPKKGDALLFWNIKPDGTSDYSSLNADCPVIKGNKWTATKWIRVKEYKE